MKRKSKLLLLTLMSIVLVLSGCGGSNGKNEGPKTTTTTTTTDAESNTYKDKYDPPVTISTVWGVDPAVKFKNGETIADNVTTKWAKEELGVDIKTLWSVTDTNDAYATKLRMSLSAGQEMPDVLVLGDETLAQELIDSKMFADVGEWFDQYASQTWKDAMNTDENVWNSFMRDGKKMAIPILDYAYNSDYVLWIRQDWLDKLKLEAPKTVDDLEKVMAAFKNQNPDGIAPKDVVPLSVGMKGSSSSTSLNNWMGDTSWVFGAYGTIPQQWNLSPSGELEYGSINEGMKPGLEKLKEWREKGYIPLETALWDENKTSEPAVAGTAGIIPGPNWMSGWPLIDTEKNTPGAVWKPYALPTGPDGKAGRHGTKIYNGVILLNKNMKHPEAFFTYQNYLFEHLADPKPGDPWEKGVFEGYDYEKDENGNYLYYNDVKSGYVNINRYWLVRDGARIPNAMMNALLSLADGNEPTTAKEIEVVNQFGAETAAAGKVVMSQPDSTYTNLFTGMPTDTMKSKWDYLLKIENQIVTEIVYGKTPITQFDSFVATWNSSGGAQVTKEVNDWYKSVK